MLVCGIDKPCVHKNMQGLCKKADSEMCPYDRTTVKLMSEIENAMKGLKYDDDKPRWDLLPLGLIVDTVQVLTFGAKKYGPNNWRNVDNAQDRYYAALMRHITAYRNGERIDPESGLSHLAHAMCNLVFMSELTDPKYMKPKACETCQHARPFSDERRYCVLNHKDYFNVDFCEEYKHE